MAISCLFCDKDVTGNGREGFTPTRTLYMCSRCGLVNLTDEAADDFADEGFNENDKNAICITLRNEWERGRRKRTGNEITYEKLKQIVSTFRELDPIEKMDRALINYEKASQHVGSLFTINADEDYPLYFSKGPEELIDICKLLLSEGLIYSTYKVNPPLELRITAKGYQKLREIKKPNRDSRQCFVAMWFADEMNEVFEKAIKPSIEFKEDGEVDPRYEAIKIDNVEHVNDINDEIIGQIRRSRFVVCDLTGYRGGVYFEAGFAYGLGLDVIYTCREDWIREEILKNESDEEIYFLYDVNGKKIPIKKEGVHFDLSHRNRIEWSPDRLEDFKVRLENRIRSVIY